VIGWRHAVGLEHATPLLAAGFLRETGAWAREAL
jgi:hypothetical protein